MAPITAVVIGAGQRGSVYSGYALDFPDRLKIVGVVEPRKFHREKLQKLHAIPKDGVFNDLASFFKKDRLADCVFVTTPDSQHKEPAVACAKKGYHILLEKPMATTAEDCREIVQTCQDNNVIIAVCHVLRYAPAAVKLKKLIQSGVIGEVVNIQLLEPVGYFHFAHSFVRGNWRNAESSCFSLLAKSCHDIDLIYNWLKNKPCTAVSSFGSLHHFKNNKKPSGAASRCLDCPVERQCAYSAKKIYLDPVMMGLKGWPTSIIADVVDIENVTEALKTGPYGRCVYDCDNNVMDNQVVNMQFEGGTTASFTMVAFTEKICERQAKIFGTLGELTCDFSQSHIRHFDFRTEDLIMHDLVEEQKDDAQSSSLRGHGGSDFYLVDSFIRAVQDKDPSKVLTGPVESLNSHLLCFAAEKSRLEKRVIDPSTE